MKVLKIKCLVLLDGKRPLDIVTSHV